MIQGQISLFDLNNKFVIQKPIRLIELFAGYGSQHFSLEYLNANFESWKICEWAVKSIQAYKDAHFKDDNTDYSKELTQKQVIDFLFEKHISMDYNQPMTYDQIKRLGENKQRQIYNNIKATNNLVDIQQTAGSDLEIVDTDKYCYIMTYSFPCQDLSSAGLGKGMAKDSGTRSGMLWEVERILNEIVTERGQLPQVLLMENVPQVHGTKNKEHFIKWIQSLENIGYSNFYQDLNAKDYGVPQTRNRCFMVSVLGNYHYEFPHTKELKLRLKDMLEAEVDEKYYLSERMANYIRSENDKWTGNNNKSIINRDIACAKTTRESQTRADASDYICDQLPENFNLKEFTKPKVLGGIGEKKSNGGRQFYQQDRIYDDNISISVTTAFNPYYAIKSKNYRLLNLVDKTKFSDKTMALDCYNQIAREDYIQTIKTNVDKSNMNMVYNDLRIRKLTPKECGRLQGLKDKDIENIQLNQSNASSYHLYGDSICIPCLMAIFSNMLDLEYTKFLDFKNWWGK